MHPWAWAVIHAGKDIENRTWRPLRPFTMLVHAGQEYDDEGEEYIHALGIAVPDEYYFGAIIGSVRVSGFTQQSRSRWAFPGYWQWQLDSPQEAVTAIACRGRPGLTTPPRGWQQAFTQER